MSTRRHDVLAALKRVGTAGVSGEALAHDLGISRAAIAKHVAALRELGYKVAAQPGVGYVLESVPDLPLAEEVAPRLRSGFWVSLGGGGETGSTNDDCKALARDGAPEGTAVLASHQTAGRGRLGRAWESPSGGVYVSVVLRPSTPLAGLSPLPLVISVGVARGLDALGVSSSLKWPNDVWLEDGKVAGILLETSAETDRADWVVAGVGMNVHRPDRPVAGAAYIDDALGRAGSSAEGGLACVAAAVLDGIAEAYEQFRVAAFDGLVAEYEKRSMLTDRDVTVCDLAGVVLAQGRVVGVDSAGCLRVDQGGSVTRVSAGDVTLKPRSV